MLIHIFGATFGFAVSLVLGTTQKDNIEKDKFRLIYPSELSNT